MKFYHCKKCGRIVDAINDGGNLACCDEPMIELTPNTTDATKEKHVPVITRAGNRITVNVGSVDHPMLEEHSIGFIAVEQGNTVQRVNLSPGEKPQAEFTIGEGPVTAYEWCNLHGLWMAQG